VTIEEAALAASCLVALPGAGYREAAQTLRGRRSASLSRRSWPRARARRRRRSRCRCARRTPRQRDPLRAARAAPPACDLSSRGPRTRPRRETRATTLPERSNTSIGPSSTTRGTGPPSAVGERAGATAIRPSASANSAGGTTPGTGVGFMSGVTVETPPPVTLSGQLPSGLQRSHRLYGTPRQASSTDP
jgi:hypothetical protein